MSSVTKYEGFGQSDDFIFSSFYLIIVISTDGTYRTFWNSKGSTAIRLTPVPLENYEY